MICDLLNMVGVSSDVNGNSYSDKISISTNCELSEPENLQKILEITRGELLRRGGWNLIFPQLGDCFSAFPLVSTTVDRELKHLIEQEFPNLLKSYYTQYRTENKFSEIYTKIQNQLKE